MTRVTSKHALEFACRSAACRPPTSGGTGGSSKGGGASGGGSGLSAAQEKALKWAESPTRAGMPHPNVVRSLEARGLIERDPATLKFRQTDKGRAALGGGSSNTGDRFDDEVEYEQAARAKLKADQAATPYIVNAWESPHFKTRTAEEVGAMSEADAIKLIQDNDATGRRILEKGVQIRDTQAVGVRANLNVKKTTGITVQTMHKGSSEQLRNGTGMFGGEAIGYGAAPILKNANFSVNQNARAAIASGEKNKFPMASVDGNFQSPTTPNGQRDQQSKFNGVEITFNPMKTHLFVDPDGRAVKGATDVTVVGSKVYARGRIEYYTPQNMPKPARNIPSEAHP